MKNKTYTFSATPAEITLIERLKKAEKRRTYSDLIRYLIMDKAEKILPQKVTIAKIKPQEEDSTPDHD